jgi:hypothetical protein
MQIFVRNLKRKPMTLLAKPSDNTETVKAMICMREDVRQEGQQLIFFGKQLED